VQHILRPFLEAYTRGGLRQILEGLHQNERVKEVQAMAASSDLGKKHVETELPSAPDDCPTVRMHAYLYIIECPYAYMYIYPIIYYIYIIH
jgi:hypothetical protein